MLSILVRVVFMLSLAFALAGCGGGGTGGPDATITQLGRMGTIEYPSADTWEELQDYISEKHDRLERFANDQPEVTVYANVTFTTGLTRPEVDALLSEYHIQLTYGEYEATDTQGSGGLYEGQLATIEASPLFNDGSFVVNAVSGRTTATECLRLLSDERIALVDADIAVGRITGTIPTDVVFQHPPSIYTLYQELKPQ